MFRAYAKINLGLLVLERRPDGYHEIETVLHRINLFDEITLQESPTIEVTSSSSGAPEGEANTCYKAAQKLRERLGISNGVRITIRKNVPVGAGLGGGSSDAATVLRELPKLWGRTIDPSALHMIAIQVGSDVPYFLEKGSALAKGRGEILEYFKLQIPFTILLCCPDIHVSTAWAYQHVKPSQRAIDLKGIVLDGMKKPLALVNGLRNDFEPIVFKEYPEVMRIKEAMMRGGAEFSSMSGSGSSVFGFFSRKDFAREVAAHLRSRRHRTFITEPDFTTE